jgi:hypothetical protein
MEEIIFESARVSFFEGILIVIGILWVAGYLKKVVYVPVIIKEQKAENEQEVIVKNNDHTIYREKKNKNESYTDFEELN